MTDLERDIRSSLLRALKAAKGPMQETALKQHIRNVYVHIAFTDGDLQQHILDAESACLICGTDDETAGKIWDLTLKGKTHAQRLR